MHALALTLTTVEFAHTLINTILLFFIYLLHKGMYMNYLYATILLFCVASSLVAMEQAKEKPKKQLSFLENFANGAAAGGIEVMMSNPLIVLKNDLILRSKGHTPQPPGPQGQPLHASAKQWAEQLIRKYYKGCGTGVLFMAPIVAVQNSTALILAELFKKDSRATYLERAMAAFCAGSLSSMIESPADLVVLQRQNPAFKTESYRETWQRIYQHRGFATFL